MAQMKEILLVIVALALVAGSESCNSASQAYTVEFYGGEGTCGQNLLIQEAYLTGGGRQAGLSL